MSKLINKLINQGQEYLLAGGGKEGDKIEYLTEEEYEALTPEQKSDEDTTYMITGEGSVGPMGDIDDSQVKHLNEEGEEDGTVQEKLNSLKEESTNLTNKVNFLELNGGFFPLLADNVIYTGSSFSYTAEEDTMLFISDSSDTYLKIDGANIAGNYTPGYIFVGEGQTITYSRSCKVYKANNTIVIDDSNVTLGLMDNTYLGAVNFDDNKVASVNSAHLGNNKVATASGTGDLNFHFEHTFNTQHSKMDSAELLMSGDLTYGDMGTVKDSATFNSDFEEVDSIDIRIAKNGYFEQDGKKYTLNLKSRTDIDYDRKKYSYEILELDDNLNIVNTTDKEKNISWSAPVRYVHGKTIALSYDSGNSPQGCLLTLDDNFDLQKQVTSRADYAFKEGYTILQYKGETYIRGVKEIASYSYPHFIKQDSLGEFTYICSRLIYASEYDGGLFIDTTNDIIYAVYYSISSGVKSYSCIKHTIGEEGCETVSISTIQNISDIEGKHGYGTFVNNEFVLDNAIEGIVGKKVAIVKDVIYFTEKNGALFATGNNVLFPTNTLSVNGNNAVNIPIIGYGPTDKVTKVAFGKAGFDTTDTVSIDVSIKNNSGTSKSVTLPKSGWSTSGNKTVGSGTSFTFNNN